jgi:orotate phosphoribosyltransferase
VRNAIKKALAEKSAEFGDFDVVAGVATAGIPHGTLLADALGKPFIYIRTKAKEHGMKNLIEGEMPKGAKVLVVEDLISTGGSSLKAVESVREEGGEVVGVIAIFTYDFPDATEAFAAQNCPFKTLTNYHAMIETALASGYISVEDVRGLQEWRLESRKS